MGATAAGAAATGATAEGAGAAAGAGAGAAAGLGAEAWAAGGGEAARPRLGILKFRLEFVVCVCWFQDIWNRTGLTRASR